MLTGKLRCSIENRVCEPGDYYCVEPGDEHVEIGLEDDTTVFLVKAMPNIQYAVEQK